MPLFVGFPLRRVPLSVYQTSLSFVNCELSIEIMPVGKSSTIFRKSFQTSATSYFSLLPIGT